MVANSKPYMNFLGGEVSPNAYKRLDMANNGKWFETAKNIYFGTTGDFRNRRGFTHIGKPYANAMAGEKVKMIPFVFNRTQSYCIAFYNNNFSILKDGQFLTDALGNRIFVEHSGLSLSSTDDLSYCQIADIVYLCAKGAYNIFTITRKSEREWEWGAFDYEIPPMRSVNSDSQKTLIFEPNNTYNSRYLCVAELKVLSPFSGINVDFVYRDQNDDVQKILLLNTNLSFASQQLFVDYFNVNNLHSDLVATCEFASNKLNFYGTSGAHSTYGDFWIEITVANGNGEQKTYTSLTPISNRTTDPSSIPPPYQFDSGFKVSSAQVVYHPLYGNEVTRNYSYSPAKTVSEFVDAVKAEAVTLQTYGTNLQNCIQYIADDAIRLWQILVTSGHIYSWDSISIPYLDGVVASSAPYVVYTSSVSSPLVESGSTSIYNISSSFGFFEDKKVGDYFCVESIFSPNRDGRPGENKNFFQSGGSFPSETGAFWSNGNWRFLTSGLFAGSIALQYSYDGQNWFTHRTFSSSIRTENDVSYGTNYNEYGTIDVDDNVLIRLKFDLSASTNLCVLLDTESFKNRSYYKIIQKNSNVSAVAECIKYNIGTPGITRYNSSTASYDISPVHEWAESAWSEKNGFPKVTFFYQNRLGFANTDRDPQTIWFSKTDNFKDFSTKVEYVDDDPITISALRATGVSEVTTVASSKKLFVFTADHEDGIMDEGALTQSNKQLIGFTYYGAEPIETRNISNKIIFVERGGRAARALTYDYSQENYEALDLTIPYKHLLTNEKIIASEYLPGDYKTYLMLTSIGRLICFKYLPEQRIEACSWFMHANGKITNICVVNTEQGYDLYIAVDAGTNKFIEYMNILPYASGSYFDSYKSYTFENAASSITDTSYFVPGVKYTVSTSIDRYDVVADSTSTITLKAAITACSVGVKYKSEATLIEPNFNMQNGTTNYNRKNMYKAHFTYENSEGFKVGVKNREKSFKQLIKIEPDNKEHAMYPRSGERGFIIQSSYLEPNMLSFVQEEPYPMHITNAEVEVDYGGK